MKPTPRQRQQVEHDLEVLAAAARHHKGLTESDLVRIDLHPNVYRLAMQLTTVAWLEAHRIVLAPRD